MAPLPSSRLISYLPSLFITVIPLSYCFHT
jgi:hypothetical protein